MKFKPLKSNVKIALLILFYLFCASFIATFAEQRADEIQGKQILQRIEDFSSKEYSKAKDDETFYNHTKAEIKRIKELLKSYKKRIDKMDPCSKGYIVSVDNYNYLVQENCHVSVDTIHKQHSVGTVVGGSLKGFIGGGITGTIKGGFKGATTGALAGCAVGLPFFFIGCPILATFGAVGGGFVGNIAGGAIGSGVGAVKGALKGKEGEEELFLFSAHDRANNCTNLELTPKIPKKDASCEDVSSFQAPACVNPNSATYSDMIGTIESY